MAWGKSEDEKEAERAAKEAKRLEQEQWQQSQELAAQRAADSAAFEASPVGRAAAAYARGDVFFQVEIQVAALTGDSSFFGSSSNTISHERAGTDVLGQVEAAGWHLENVGYVFIETGSTTTDRVLLSGQGMVTEGNVTGIYLFRRVDRTAATA